MFCDGDFWHGKDWQARKHKLSSGTNSDYWVAKIESNMERDLRVQKHLEDIGWTALRIWESDILSDCDSVAHAVHELVKRKTNSLSI